MSTLHQPRPGAGFAVVSRRALLVVRPVPGVLAACALAACLLAACASRGATPTQAPNGRPGAEAGIPTDPPSGSTAVRGGRDSTSAAIGGAPTIERLFAGRFAGVTVEQATDGGLRILIRGGTPHGYTNEEPLYIVDGTPLPGGTGGIVHLNPYDISKIEVLKNPQDTGIYGLRGSNGVIRITTIRPGGR